MKLRPVIAIAVLAALPLIAVSQELVLPEDLLLGGEVSKVLSVKQLTEATFEVTQLVQMKGATPLNLATFCTGGWLAYQRGFAGLTLGVPSGADPAAKPVLTVVLLKNESQLATLPTTHKWIQYLDLKGMRKGCTQFLQQKYVWPAD